MAAVDCTTRPYPIQGTDTTVALDPRTGETLAWSGNNTVRTSGKTERESPSRGC